MTARVPINTLLYMDNYHLPDLPVSLRRDIDIFLARLHAALLPPLSRVLLYGSQARGEANADSDVDLAIVLEGADPGDDTIFTLFDRLTDMQVKVDMETSRPVSPMIVWEQSLDQPENTYNPDFYRPV